MSVVLAELEEQIRALAADERARLVEVLLDSLRATEVAEVEQAWQQEIAARLAAYDRGETPTFAAEEVFAEARRLAE